MMMILGKFWQYIAMAALIGALYWVHCAHQNTKDEFAKFQADVKAIGDVAIEENKRNAKKREFELSELKAQHEKELAEANIDRFKAKEELKNEIIENNAIRNALARIKRLQQERTSESRVSEVQETAIISTDTRESSDRTIKRLIDAGKSCYFDYKALYNAWQRQCDIYGCE